MTYRGITILEHWVGHEVWDNGKCVQVMKSELIDYLVEEIDGGSAYEDLHEAQAAIDKLLENQLVTAS